MRPYVKHECVNLNLQKISKDVEICLIISVHFDHHYVSQLYGYGSDPLIF